MSDEEDKVVSISKNKKHNTTFDVVIEWLDGSVTAIVVGDISPSIDSSNLLLMYEDVTSEMPMMIINSGQIKKLTITEVKHAP